MKIAQQKMEIMREIGSKIVNKGTHTSSSITTASPVIVVSESENEVIDIKSVDAADIWETFDPSVFNTVNNQRHVACPICQIDFPVSEIEAHSDLCASQALEIFKIKFATTY